MKIDKYARVILLLVVPFIFSSCVTSKLVGESNQENLVWILIFFIFFIILGRVGELFGGVTDSYEETNNVYNDSGQIVGRVGTGNWHSYGPKQLKGESYSDYMKRVDNMNYESKSKWGNVAFLIPVLLIGTISIISDMDKGITSYPNLNYFLGILSIILAGFIGFIAGVKLWKPIKIFRTWSEIFIILLLMFEFIMLLFQK